jgi:hypothetical protein
VETGELALGVKGDRLEEVRRELEHRDLDIEVGMKEC